MATPLPDRKDFLPPTEQPDSGAPPATNDAGNQLLDHVLRHTDLARSSATTALVNPDVLRALAEVRTRYGQASTIEMPMVRDLVDAVLRESWPNWRKELGDRNDLIAEIVLALCDDPVARARLENCWARLSEGPR